MMSNSMKQIEEHQIALAKFRIEKEAFYDSIKSNLKEDFEPPRKKQKLCVFNDDEYDFDFESEVSTDEDEPEEFWENYVPPVFVPISSRSAWIPVPEQYRPPIGPEGRRPEVFLRPPPGSFIPYSQRLNRN